MYRTTAKVGAGHRIELVLPDVAEGDEIEVIVLPCASTGDPIASAFSIIENLDLPIRDSDYWEEREGELRESRDSWDR